MALEISRPLSIVDPLAAAPPYEQTIADRVKVRVVNVANFQEATLRKLVTPQVDIDQDRGDVRITSSGLSLTEERRSIGKEAILLEVAARYRRGEGAIKQIYRYLVFTENGTTYCQRLPMGSWAPTDPDICLEWLGRGGLQQGDFVLLPLRRLPTGAAEIKRPPKPTALMRAVVAVQQFIAEALLDDDAGRSEWERLIGRHEPEDCQLFKKDARVYLVAPHDTVSSHPEHAQLRIPEGTYEIVEDRASAYWKRAID